MRTRTRRHPVPNVGQILLIFRRRGSSESEKWRMSGTSKCNTGRKKDTILYPLFLLLILWYMYVAHENFIREKLGTGKDYYLVDPGQTELYRRHCFSQNVIPCPSLSYGGFVQAVKVPAWRQVGCVLWHEKYLISTITRGDTSSLLWLLVLFCNPRIAAVKDMPERNWGYHILSTLTMKIKNKMWIIRIFTMYAR